MSNVYARNREETELLFLVKARELQKEITTFVMREKVLPKKWRLAIGLDLIKKADELVDNVTAANTIRVNKNSELKLLRKMYQQIALSNCFQLQNRMVRAEKCVSTVKPEYKSRIIELINHEWNLLKAWIKSEE